MRKCKGRGAHKSQACSPAAESSQQGSVANKNLVVAETPFSQEEQRDLLGTSAGAVAELRDLGMKTQHGSVATVVGHFVSDRETKPPSMSASL